MTDCGPGGAGSESCCASLEVPGGTFDRSYDDVTFTQNGSPATISGLRLDRYEMTVGRFRQFVSAVVGGWSPMSGSGKHGHLNGGAGLNGTGGGHESGWDGAWTSLLATTSGGWSTNLSCSPTYQTWTASAGANEDKPINCETWYEAYAFCIWDGGFLPSEAEWNYAAAGGGGASGQRAFPWSTPSTDTTVGCSYANYAGVDGGVLCMSAGPDNVGTDSPTGDGAFGQADLAGNVWEWNLDWYAAAYFTPCTDCAVVTSSGTSRVIRGASFNDDTSNLLVSTRYYTAPGTPRFYNIGARCGRTP
jgi:sulfatase modifying factor 1